MASPEDCFKQVTGQALWSVTLAWPEGVFPGKANKVEANVNKRPAIACKVCGTLEECQRALSSQLLSRKNP